MYLEDYFIVISLYMTSWLRESAGISLFCSASRYKHWKHPIPDLEIADCQTMGARGCFLFLKMLLIYFFRERGVEGERQGEKHRCERETWMGCFPHMPWPGIDPITWVCALTRNQKSDFWLCGTMPNQLSHTGQGWRVFWSPSAVTQLSPPQHEYSFSITFF